MNLANILLESARKHPDRTAVAFYDRRIRYSELRAAVLRFGAALREMGIATGDRVAVALPNVPEFAVVYYGALAAGAEVVCVNPMYTAREIGWFFDDARVKLAVAHPMFAAESAEAASRRAVRLLYSDSMGDPAKFDVKAAVAGAPGEITPVDRHPRDTAMIVYTNACRGVPLGACLTHGGLEFDARVSSKVAMVFETDVFLSILPLFHAFSLTVCLNLPIITGAATILHEMFKEQRAVETLRQEPISIFPAVPTMYHRILKEFGGRGLDFSSVRAFIPGGAPPTYPDLYRDFSSAFKAHVYEGYGITECGPVTSVNPIRSKESRSGSIGLPLDEVDVKIVDGACNELPRGETGELAVRGENVMEKYLNRPDETDNFLRDGWFLTGDLANLDRDGFIFLKGLKKRMAIVGGFNVYPAEVERELGEHPAVRSCRVFGRPDETLGERVTAEVGLEPGAEVSSVELQKFLRKALAPYKIPKPIYFV